MVSNDFELIEYSLYYTRIGVIGEVLASEKFSYRPGTYYSLDFAELASTIGKRDYSNIVDPYGGSEVSQITSALLHELILYAQHNDANVIVLPEHTETYLAFCSSLEPAFVRKLKKSFLTNSILSFVLQHYLSRAQATKNMARLEPFLDDFRKGISEIVEKFGDAYELTPSQTQSIVENVAGQEARILHYLDPARLKSLFDIDISTIADVGETVLDVAKVIPIPLPIGTFIECAKKLIVHEKFKKENLNFGLSLMLMQQLLNTKPASQVVNCKICNLSVAEIANITDVNVQDIFNREELCRMHMIDYVHVRKKFNLIGQDLIIAVKCFKMEDLTAD